MCTTHSRLMCTTRDRGCVPLDPRVGRGTIPPENFWLEVLTITAESGADVQTYAETPACADDAGKPTTQAVPTLEKGKPLPDGIPEEIEVDVGGRTAQWKQAHVVGVVSGKMVCQFVGGRRIKTPVSGKDISWRVPLAA